MIIPINMKSNLVRLEIVKNELKRSNKYQAIMSDMKLCRNKNGNFVIMIYLTDAFTCYFQTVIYDPNIVKFYIDDEKTDDKREEDLLQYSKAKFSYPPKEQKWKRW